MFVPGVPGGGGGSSVNAQINYYNREEALLARDNDAAARLGGIAFSIDEQAYNASPVHLRELLTLGTINLSEYERLITKQTSGIMTDFGDLFASMYGYIPASSGSGSPE